MANLFHLYYVHRNKTTEYWRQIRSEPSARVFQNSLTIVKTLQYQIITIISIINQCNVSLYVFVPISHAMKEGTNGTDSIGKLIFFSFWVKKYILKARPCPFIKILSWFNPDFILILSKFYPDKIRIKSG